MNTTDQQKKVPIWFWVVAIFLLLWNLMGVVNLFMQITITDEALQAMPEIDREFIERVPQWIFFAFGLAVFGGLGGSIALLLKKKIALPMFIASLIGIVVQFGHGLFLAIDMQAHIMRIVSMAILLIVIGIFAIWLSRYSTAKNWIA